MGDIINDGMTSIWFLPDVANPEDGVTVDEIEAGLYLGKVLTANGLEGFEASPGEVDNSSFDSTFDTKAPGISSYSGTRLILKKQTGIDVVYTTLTVKNTTGFIGARFDVPKTAPPTPTTDKLTLFPIITGDFGRMAPERNTVARYWLATPISDEPIKDVPVLAGTP